MLCGEPVVLSITVTSAVGAPAAPGVKCPWIAQLPPAATLVPQLFAKTNDEASVPVPAMLVNTSVAPPVLVNVTLCDALVVPTFCIANFKLDRESDTAEGFPPSP